MYEDALGHTRVLMRSITCLHFPPTGEIEGIQVGDNVTINTTDDGVLESNETNDRIRVVMRLRQDRPAHITLGALA
eukprot:5483518-Lingulodinium_polyedra.AAC.1